MNTKFVISALVTTFALSAHAGVKVTSLDLKTNGPLGYVNVSLDGRSTELPDVKVNGKIIEVTLAGAENFNAISKKVSGAELSANVLNGKAIVKAVLPYEVKADGVEVGWKNKSFEVIFPRGKVKTEAPVAAVIPAPTTGTPKNENKVMAKVESTIAKESLNEDYLNNLMKEENSRKEIVPPKDAKDEVKVKQASIAKPVASVMAPNAQSEERFSFAGYTVKFGVFLALVLGLFYGVVQLLKKGVFNRGKLGFLNNSQMIQVLSTTYVSPKRSLMVVKAHKQIFLVANSENGLQFLSEMTDTSGLIKEGEKLVTGTNFDLNLGSAETTTTEESFKLKENINESTPVPEEKGIAALSAKDIVKFSDELKKKARKLKPIEFN
jgi:flagellar biogenesis protein FliO